LRRSAKELVAAVHDLSHQLHSSTFQHLGLVGGLRGICRSISQQHHIAVDFQHHEISELSYDTSLCLFRVAQEALNNAVKHGRAKQIAVQLVQNNGSVQLIIKDAGIGFDSRERSTGLGLVSMQERLRILGGTLSLISSPGHGTLIEAVVKTASSVTACPD